MTITDLIARFRILIRDNGTTQALTDPEVTQFINDGLNTYSIYRPRKRPTTISVVAGQTDYPLPSDWMDREYESFEKAINPEIQPDPMALSPFTFVAMTQITAQPMGASAGAQYNFYPSDLKMTITPAPTVVYTLSFDYFATHVADASSVSVPLIDLDNYLLPGAAKALRSIAADYSVKLQRYKMGQNIEVDNKTVADHLGSRADELDKRFERDIIKRPFGIAG